MGFCFIKVRKKLLEYGENAGSAETKNIQKIGRNGENAGSRHFLHFSQCFGFFFFFLCRAPLLSRQRARLENRRSLVRPSIQPIFLSMIDDSHCDRIHTSLASVHCFENGYVEKQPVAWKQYCTGY